MNDTEVIFWYWHQTISPAWVLSFTLQFFGTLYLRILSFT